MASGVLVKHEDHGQRQLAIYSFGCASQKTIYCNQIIYNNHDICTALLQHLLLTALYRKFLKVDMSLVL